MRGVAAWAFLMCGSAAAAAPAPDGMVDSQVAPGVSIELAHADVIEHALADWLRRHPERLPRLDGLSIRLSPPPAAPHDTQGVYLRLPGGRWRVEPLDWRRAWPVAATCTGALLVAACPPVTIPVVLLRYAWELRRDPSQRAVAPGVYGVRGLPGRSGLVLGPSACGVRVVDHARPGLCGDDAAATLVAHVGSAGRSV